MPQRVWAIASVALAIAMTVAKFIYPSRLLGRGVGLNAMVASVAAAVGPSMAAAFSALRLSIR